MKNKISIIVAVYNTEKYIKKCIDSLLTQTYSNIEIIIVEDCSLDNSKKILSNYKKSKNVKIIYNETNKGLSYSRNIGLKNATGDYIGYIDSDDYVDPDFYEKLMASIITEDSDLAVCDMKIVYENDGTEFINRACVSSLINDINIINNGLSATCCNKLFKRNLIEKYPFEVGKINEDVAVVLPIVCEANKISYVRDSYYYYVQRNNSIQNTSFNEKKFDIFHGVELTLERIKKNNNFEIIKDIIVYNQLITLLLYVITKEKNLIKRYKILKKYSILIQDFEIVDNKTFNDEINKIGKKHEIYYKLLIKLIVNKKIFMSNALIFLYDILSKILKRKKVIKKNIDMNDLIEMAKKQSKLNSDNIKVSVVVPNYNYSKFLYQRLYSILSQNYKIYEIIILDDKSSDNSIEIIDEINNSINKYVKIVKEYNNVNSGSAFKQWKKGFEIASGDYVWIAEADDYCSDKMLKKLVEPCKKNNDIYISYCDTAFIDTTGRIVIKSIKPQIDIQNTKHWDNNYINNGKDEFELYTFLNCTIANVSSSIIKNGDYSKFFEISKNFKQSGDWIFYANLMQLGSISYCKDTLNYYRIHGNNVSSITEKETHFNEILKIHKYFDKTYKLNDEQREEINKRYTFLRKVWNLEDEYK